MLAMEEPVGEAHGTSVRKGTDEALARRVTVRIFMPRLPVADEVIAAVQAAAKLNDSRLVRIFDADYHPRPERFGSLGPESPAITP